MKEIYFKVELLSDIVLNSSLATEGNLSTLDYIPGSNFLGIVAAKLYNNNTDSNENYEIFHSGKVRFGDATLSKEGLVSYSMPVMYYTDKLKKDLTCNPIYLDYLIDRETPPTDATGKRLQLKQVRGGYFLSNFELVDEIYKAFAIKSAQDRKTRTSEKGKMFGFESLQKGQEFVFSVQFDDEQLAQKIVDTLVGTHRLGKSRNAEFGQIEVEEISKPQLLGSFDLTDKVLVYAQSNLCFVDEYGMPTFQPTAEQLGLDGGEVDYGLSQIRTHIYSPWNFKRNTSNTQRNCIAKGSVFVVNGATKQTDSDVVGSFQAEGLGKVLYNPLFLEGNEDAASKVRFTKAVKNDLQLPQGLTKLSKYLKKKMTEKSTTIAISEAVHGLVYSNDSTMRKLKKISSSQWGGIRAYATKTNSIEVLEKHLFDKEIGYLTHGVADEKYWGANRGVNLKAFNKIFNDNKMFGTEFIAKFAAEMAKESRKAREIKNQQ